MKILSIDLGTKTGWALSHPDGTITSGVENFKPSRFEGGGMRFLRFKRWLNVVNESAGGIECVYFEEVRRHLGVDAAHVYGGFMAHLTAWCEINNIPYTGIPVGTIKKHATNYGNANKDKMIEAAARISKQKIFDDNQADAICLLDYAVTLEFCG